MLATVCMALLTCLWFPTFPFFPSKKENEKEILIKVFKSSKVNVVKRSQVLVLLHAKINANRTDDPQCLLFFHLNLAIMRVATTMKASQFLVVMASHLTNMRKKKLVESPRE